MQFPTGGKVRERKLNRCDSGTDSIVWMKEELRFYAIFMPWVYPGAFLFGGKRLCKAEKKI